MSIIEQARSRSGPAASVGQVVAGTLVSIAALFTAQMAALTAWVDTFGMPGDFGDQRVDALGRPLTGWQQAWHMYGPLLWGVYALVLLVVGYRMWRTILTRPGRAGWGYVLLLVALTCVFWGMEQDRFHL
jgi:hypothetical protein